MGRKYCNINSHLKDSICHLALNHLHSALTLPEILAQGLPATRGPELRHPFSVWEEDGEGLCKARWEQAQVTRPLAVVSWLLISPIGTAGRGGGTCWREPGILVFRTLCPNSPGFTPLPEHRVDQRAFE